VAEGDVVTFFHTRSNRGISVERTLAVALVDQGLVETDDNWRMPQEFSQSDCRLERPTLVALIAHLRDGHKERPSETMASATAQALREALGDVSSLELTSFENGRVDTLVSAAVETATAALDLYALGGMRGHGRQPGSQPQSRYWTPPPSY
jgi:hypothetical protein